MASESIPLYTFSGTGNTLYAAQTLCDILSKRDIKAEVFTFPLSDNTIPGTMPPLFGMAGPILGFALPRLLTNLGKSLPRGSGQKVFILITAGGGSSPVNMAAHWQLQRTLEKKGYQVSYVRYLAMGSNWMIKYDDAVNKALSDAVIHKMTNMADQLLAGIIRDPKPGIFLRLTAAFTHWQEDNMAARLFGRSLGADESCTMCGICVRNCPSGNIQEKGGAIAFGWKCSWCMKCVYQCPQQAIYPRLFKFSVVKGGYLHKQVLLMDRNLPVTPKGQKMMKRFNKYLKDPSL